MDEVAHVQEDDMVGTVALDHGDFDRYEELLNIDGWTILRLRLDAAHPPLFGNSAVSSYTFLSVWAVSTSAVSQAGGVPNLLASQRPVIVAEISLHNAAEIEYTSTANALALLLRGAKRLQIDLWADWVRDADLRIVDFSVTRRFALDWSSDGWTNLHERLEG